MNNFYRRTSFSVASFCVFVSLSLCSLRPAPASIVLPLRSKKGMVVSAQPLASEAGLSMLRQGGNAVDAAVATALAISVVEPFSAGIGGGGFLLMSSSQGETRALDFRERAPLKATRTMYLDAQGKVRRNASVKGYLAAAVPGTVAGLYEAQHRYGKLSWQQVISPAIALANDGFIISPRSAWRLLPLFATRQQELLINPAARQIFTHDGALYAPSERLVQRDLARTLRAIALNPQSFYTGSIAQAIAADMAKNGGLITLQDLKAYKPVWRTPLCGNFRQDRICTMPPPSSGGVLLLEMLNIVGDTDLKAMGWHAPDALHLLVEAMQIAYADRSQYLGDPDFFKVPVTALISRGYAAKRRQEIRMDRAMPSTEVQPADRKTIQQFNAESSETSHLNVVDEQRNAVSLTFTINLGFGAGVVVPGTGIVLNDEMDDFDAAPGVPNAFGLVGGEANAIAPRKIPLSSMTPTIVTENGRLRLVTGSPGGSTIITTVLQIVLNVLDYGMDTGAAVSVPRIHYQWLPDQVRVEKYGLDAATLTELRRRGHRIQEQSPWGNANAIAVSPDGSLEGAADPRGEGLPSGF